MAERAGMSAATAQDLHRSNVEWWLVHGFYEGKDSGRRYFVSTTVQHDVALETAPPVMAYSFQFNVLDPRAARSEMQSKVDATLLDSLVRHGHEAFGRSNLDRGLVNVFLQELADHGAPAEIEVDPSGPLLKSVPLGVAWNGFALSQSGPGFRLESAEPVSRRPVRVQLDPPGVESSVGAKGGNGWPTGGSGFFACPRLRLSGMIAGEHVTGEACVEHQAGGPDWLSIGTRMGRAIGSDWFGISLEDGSDWQVMVHRDAQSGVPSACQATVWDACRRRRTSADCSATPVRTWQSPRTHIRHPVDWQIRATALGADLRFVALADDQEVTVLGPARALWAGAGVVSGTVSGSAVRGRATGRFQGYGYLFDFQQYLDDFAARIDRLLEAFLPKQMDETSLERYVGPAHWQHEPQAHTAMLCRPVWDLIGRKGKRWRPAFLILILEALGVLSEPYQDLLCVYSELAHTGSLIIDDIEDRSRIRRGDECIHLRYGLNTAINAGNLLYFLPSLLLMDHAHLSERQRLRIHEILSRSYVRSHFGQTVDLYWSQHLNNDNLDRWLGDSLGPKILQMYGYKTAAFVAGFAEIATVIAQAGEEMRRACTSYAWAFGVAFQIMDDVRNFSTSPHWTKACGEDLAEGKLTYVIWRALALLDTSQRSRLCELLGSETLRKSAAGMQEGMDLIRRSGALRACGHEARGLVEREWAVLDRQLPPSEAKVMFRLLCLRILDLAYDP